MSTRAGGASPSPQPPFTTPLSERDVGGIRIDSCAVALFLVRSFLLFQIGALSLGWENLAYDGLMRIILSHFSIFLECPKCQKRIEAACI